jgi:hypothetical protein
MSKLSDTTMRAMRLSRMSLRRRSALKTKTPSSISLMMVKSQKMRRKTTLQRPR